MQSPNKEPSLATEEKSWETDATRSLKSRILRMISHVLFLKQRVIHGTILRDVRGSAILYVTHDMPVDPSLIIATVEGILPGVPVKTTAEFGFAANKIWSKSPFRSYVIPVANARLIPKMGTTSTPSPFSRQERRIIQQTATEEMRKVIEDRGILITQAFGMQGTRKSEEEQIKNPLRTHFLREALAIDPNIAIIPVKMTYGSRYWRMSNPFRETTITFGSDLNAQHNLRALLQTNRREFRDQLERQYLSFLAG